MYAGASGEYGLQHKCAFIEKHTPPPQKKKKKKKNIQKFQNISRAV